MLDLTKLQSIQLHDYALFGDSQSENKNIFSMKSDECGLESLVDLPSLTSFVLNGEYCLHHVGKSTIEST